MRGLKFSTVLLCALFIASIALLFTVKHKVLRVSKEVYKINNDIMHVQQNIEVLEAEWSYLTHPVRLEQLANRYLALEPIVYTQIIGYSLLASPH